MGRKKSKKNRQLEQERVSMISKDIKKVDKVNGIDKNNL